MIDVSLGIDIGTGSTKAGLVDRHGRLRAVGRCPHVMDHDRPGRSEIDPTRWLDSTRAAVTDALAQLPDAGVATIGLSGQMHGVVLCTSDGTPTRPAVLWPDRRADRRLRELEPLLRAHLDALANPLAPGMAGPILATLAEEDPDAVRSARWALQPKDWVRSVWTGEVATEPSDASATLLWDLARDTWHTQVMQVFGVDAGMLPPVLRSNQRAGALLPGPATRLGLEVGTPVAVGGADTAAALFGAGLVPGETQVSVGTGGQIAISLDEARADVSRRTHLYRGVGDRRWYAMAAIQNAGLAVDWALDVLGAGFDDAEAAVTGVAPGSDGVTFVPYLTGERTPHLDPTLTGRWVGLHPGATRASLLRSVFEGVAFAMRDGLDALRAAGHPIDRALLAGGGSAAGWWQQLLADALQVPLVPHDASDASVRGAALLGWHAIGRDLAPSDHVRRAAAVVPDTDVLDEALQRFRTVTAA